MKNNLKILLVDDCETDFMITDQHLQKHQDYNFDIQWASSYREGVEKALSGEYDLNLLDYQLDENTGLDLAKEIQSKGCTRPNILVTAAGYQDISHNISNEHLHGYIGKKHLSSATLINEMQRVMATYKKTAKSYAQNSPDAILSKLIVDNVDQPIMLLDKNAKIVTINHGVLTHLNLEKEDILNIHASLILRCSKQSINDFIHENKQGKIYTNLHDENKLLSWIIKPLNNPIAPNISAIAMGRLRSGHKKSERGIFKKMVQKFEWFTNTPQYIQCNNLYYNRDIFKKG